MYYRHFGLSGPPFHFTVSRRLYISDTHREALAALEWGLLHEPSGFTLLTGETGAGKTTLVSSILTKQYEHVHTTYVSNPKSGFHELLREVMNRLGIEARPLTAEMMVAFGRFLAGLKRNERVVIVVDEGQTATDDTLEDIRLFADWAKNAGHDKQIHFLLIGQPDLSRKLMEPRLKPLNDRIGARAMLEPLTPKEALAYVDFHLREQSSNTGKIFKHRALAYIVDHSDGLPRRLNVICHNAMLLAYAAGRRKVSVSFAREAVDEYRKFLSGAPLSGVSNSGSGSQRERLHFGPGIAVVPITLLALATGYFEGRKPLLGTRATIEAPAPRAKRLPDPVVSETPSAVASVAPVAQASASPTIPFAETSLMIPSAKVSPTLPSAEVNTVNSATVGHSLSTNASEARSQGEVKHHPRWVVARRGDTLRSIAVKYLGSEHNLRRLIAANPQLRGYGIRRGEVIYLPNDGNAVREE
jgi:general secretion pathway protein A